jgi:putative RNA 2'-phosphotransferase
LIAAERLSRFLSYVLRHRPAEYPVAFDRHGFVELPAVIELVRQRFSGADEGDVRRIVEAGEKQRFELRDGKVRATYGHSFPVDLGLEPVVPPPQLYYGVARDLAQSILRGGLKPRGRRYVHLSESLEEAAAVGRRRDPAPAIVVVHTGAARQENVCFYRSGPVFLADLVPPQFLSLYSV